jgi:uncharacterized protein YndB with AHSA1/START domain
MELRPGGTFVTEMSENGGAFLPHLNACFLDILEGERIVFSDALTGGWRPFFTAVITLADHPKGTEYRVMSCTRTARTGTDTKNSAFMMAGAPLWHNWPLSWNRVAQRERRYDEHIRNMDTPTDAWKHGASGGCAMTGTRVSAKAKRR